MDKYKNKYRIWIKVMATVVVCLFTINTTAAIPQKGSFGVIDTLQVQSRLNPILRSAGWENDIQIDIETAVILSSVLRDPKTPYHVINAELDKWMSMIPPVPGEDRSRFLNVVSPPVVDNGRTIIEIELFRGENKGKRFRITSTVKNIQEIQNGEDKINIVEVHADNDPDMSTGKPVKKTGDSMISADAVGEELQDDMILDNDARERLVGFCGRYLQLMDKFVDDPGPDSEYIKEYFSAKRIANMFYLSEVYGFNIFDLMGGNGKTIWSKQAGDGVIQYLFTLDKHFAIKIFDVSGESLQEINLEDDFDELSRKYKEKEIGNFGGIFIIFDKKEYGGLNLGNFGITARKFSIWAQKRKDIFSDIDINETTENKAKLRRYYESIGANSTDRDYPLKMWLSFDGLDAGILTKKQSKRIGGLDKRIWRVWSQRKVDRYFRGLEKVDDAVLFIANKVFSKMHESDDIDVLRRISPDEVAGFVLDFVYNTRDIMTSADAVAEELQDDMVLDDAARQRLTEFHNMYLKLMDKVMDTLGLDNEYIKESFSAKRIADMFYLFEVYGFNIFDLMEENGETDWIKQTEQATFKYTFKAPAQKFPTRINAYSVSGEPLGCASSGVYDIFDQIKDSRKNIGNFIIKTQQFLFWAMGKKRKVEAYISLSREINPVIGLVNYYESIGAKVIPDYSGKHYAHFDLFGGLNAGILTGNQSKRIENLDKRIWRVWSQRMVDRYFKGVEKVDDAMLLEANKAFSKIHESNDIDVLRRTSPDEVVRFVLEFVKKTGQRDTDEDEYVSLIGKRAFVESIRFSDGEVKAVVKDSYCNHHDLALMPEGKLDIGRLKARMNNMGASKKEHKKMLTFMLGLIERSPPEFYTFTAVIEDLLGFASPENDLIALHKDLSDDPIALFHEMGEYLVKSGRMKLRLKSNMLKFSLDGRSFTVKLRGVALSIAEKGPDKPHYLLRGLQRELFGQKDKKLTDMIKKEQGQHQKTPGVEVKEESGYIEHLTLVKVEGPNPVNMFLRKDLLGLLPEDIVRNMGKVISGQNDTGFIKNENQERTKMFEFPVSIQIKDIECDSLSVKGCDPVMKNYFGIGRPQIDVFYDKNGDVSHLPTKDRPIGAMFLEKAINEFDIHMELEENGFNGDVRVKVPVGYGEYVNMRFGGKRVGFVIFALDDKRNPRAKDFIDSLVVTALSPLMRDGGISVKELAVIKKDTILKRKLEMFFEGMGKGLRKFHEAGFIHKYPHQENFYTDITCTSGNKLNIDHIYVHDLDNALRISDLSERQALSYMSNDITSSMTWIRDAMSKFEDFETDLNGLAFLNYLGVDAAYQIYKGYFPKQIDSDKEELFRMLQFLTIGKEFGIRKFLNWELAYEFLEEARILGDAEFDVIFDGNLLPVSVVLDEMIKNKKKMIGVASTADPNKKKLVLTPHYIESSGRYIGKRAFVEKIRFGDGEVKAVVKDSRDRRHDLALKPEGKLDIGRLKARMNNMGASKKEHKKMLTFMLGLIERSPPELYTFTTVIEDLLGFASPENNFIALHKDLSDDPLALFHEMGEYLVKSGRMRLWIKGHVVEIVLDGNLFKVRVRKKAFSIAAKGAYEPHYLLRALQRELFGRKDKRLTYKIKKKQPENMSSDELVREAGKIMTSAGPGKSEWDMFNKIVAELKKRDDVEVAVLAGPEMVDGCNIIYDERLSEDAKVFSWKKLKIVEKEHKFSMISEEENTFLTDIVENVNQHVRDGAALIVKKKEVAKNGSIYTKISIIDNGKSFLNDETGEKVSIDEAINYGEYASFGKGGKKGVGLPEGVWQTNMAVVKIPGQSAIVSRREYLKYRVGVDRDIENKQERGTIVEGYFLHDDQYKEKLRALLKNELTRESPLENMSTDVLAREAGKIMTSAGPGEIEWDMFNKIVAELKKRDDVEVDVLAGPEMIDDGSIDIDERLSGDAIVQFPWEKLDVTAKKDGFSTAYNVLKEKIFLKGTLENIIQHVKDGVTLVVREKRKYSDGRNYTKISVTDNGTGFIDENGKKVSIEKAIIVGEKEGSFGRYGHHGLGLSAALSVTNLSVIKVPEQNAIIAMNDEKRPEVVFSVSNDQERGTIVEGYFLHGDQNNEELGAMLEGEITRGSPVSPKKAAGDDKRENKTDPLRGLFSAGNTGLKYYVEEVIDKKKIRGTLSAWFSPGEDRDIKKRRWDIAIKRSRSEGSPGFFVKLRSGGGEILGIAYYHKMVYRFIEKDKPVREKMIYYLDCMEVAKTFKRSNIEGRGKGLGNILLAKIIERIMNDPDIDGSEEVLVADVADDEEYSKERKRARDFYERTGFEPVYDPAVEGLTDEEKGYDRFVALRGDEAEKLLDKARGFERPEGLVSRQSELFSEYEQVELFSKKDDLMSVGEGARGDELSGEEKAVKSISRLGDGIYDADAIAWGDEDIIKYLAGQMSEVNYNSVRRPNKERIDGWVKMDPSIFVSGLSEDRVRFAVKDKRIVGFVEFRYQKRDFPAEVIGISVLREYHAKGIFKELMDGAVNAFLEKDPNMKKFTFSTFPEKEQLFIRRYLLFRSADKDTDLDWWLEGGIEKRKGKMTLFSIRIKKKEGHNSRKDREIEKRIDSANDNIRKVVHAVKRYLAGGTGVADAKGRAEPIDIVIDLSLMNRGDLEETVKELALLILRYMDLENVNFIFKRPSGEGEWPMSKELRADIDNAPEEWALTSMLIKEIRDRAVEFKQDNNVVNKLVKERLNAPVRNGAVEVQIISKAYLKWFRDNGGVLKPNQYPVAMDEFTMTGNKYVALRNFDAALAIGLSEAALVIAKGADDKNGGGTELRELKDLIYPRLTRLYEAVFGEKYITLFGQDKGYAYRTFDNMIYSEGNDHGAALRMNLAISLALPPVARRLVDGLLRFHDRVQNFMRSA